MIICFGLMLMFIVNITKNITEKEVIEKFLPKKYAISFIHRLTYYSE